MLDERDVQTVLDTPSWWGARGRPDTNRRVIGRDLVDDLGAIATLRPSGRAGWFADLAVYRRTTDAWEPEYDNGEVWPPLDARRTGPPFFVTLTGVTSARVGGVGARFALRAGTLASDVARLEARSASGTHDVEIEPDLGTFIALTIHGEHAEFELRAMSRAGQILEVSRYRQSLDL